MAEIFDGKLGLIQRVKPSYRVSFFDCLAGRCKGGLALFAGQPLSLEGIPGQLQPNLAKFIPVQNLHFSDPSRALYFCYQKGLYDSLSAWNPDALILEANFRYLSSPHVIRWMKDLGRPVIGWGLGAKTLPKFLQPFRNRFLKKFDALIAYSEQGAEEYARVGIPSARILVARNAVTDAPSGTDPLRQPAAGRKPIVLFVGRLQERKKVTNLIRATSTLSENIQPHLVIVGDGPEATPLRALAHQILPDTEFTGHLEGDALAERFLQADLFVLPGTGGLAIQQAMAYALPLIVAEGDGTQRDLVTPLNGWLIPAGDEQPLQAALASALADPHKLLEMGKESFRIVKHQVNIQTMADVFIQAIALASR